MGNRQQGTRHLRDCRSHVSACTAGGPTSVTDRIPGSTLRRNDFAPPPPA